MYIRSWFAIDVISILPMDKILAVSTTKLVQLTKFGRFARFTKLLRLFRIIRMAKLFRLFKDRKRIAQASDSINIDANVARLMVFGFIMIMMVHTLGCLWILLTKINE